MCTADPRAAMFDFSDMEAQPPIFAPDPRAEQEKRDQAMKRTGLSALMSFMPSTSPAKILKKAF